MKHLNKILFLIIFIIGFYSLFIEPNKLKINHYIIKEPKLSGLKIVFASDFHIKPYQQKRLEKVVELINAENPDIVLSTGDFVSGHSEKMTMPIENIAKELNKVKSKYGFYTSLGNHDGKNAIKITKALEKNNIKVLNNKNVAIKTNNKTVYIAGLEDLKTGKPNINRALSGVKSPIILLTHTPDLFPKVPSHVNLTLAGHTHGGQIIIPLLGPLFTASKYKNKYAKGLIIENNKKLITTKGIGTSVLPIRFNCIPEIIVIEFK